MNIRGGAAINAASTPSVMYSGVSDPHGRTVKYTNTSSFGEVGINLCEATNQMQDAAQASRDPPKIDHHRADDLEPLMIPTLRFKEQILLDAWRHVVSDHLIGLQHCLPPRCACQT